MVEHAEWAEIIAARRPAVLMIVRMVLLGLARGTATPREHTRAIADLDMTPQRRVREPIPGPPIQLRQQTGAVSVLGGQVRDQRLPPGRRVRGKLFEQGGGDLQFDRAAMSLSDQWTPTRSGMSGWAAASGAGQDQVAVGVGNGEAPLRVLLAGQTITSSAGRNRAKPGDLAGMIIMAEQGGQT